MKTLFIQQGRKTRFPSRIPQQKRLSTTRVQFGIFMSIAQTLHIAKNRIEVLA